MEKMDLRIVPDIESCIAETRMWYKDNFMGIQKARNWDVNLKNFK